MVLNNIEKLLEKYENGVTTLKEEQQLKDYFSQETVAPHLESYKPLFGYFLVNHQEQFTKDVPLTTKKVFNYKWLGVAAVAVLMFGMYFNTTFVSQDDLGTYSESEKQLALNKVKQSLKLVSKAFNKGAEKVSYLSHLEKAGTQVEYLGDMNAPLKRIFKKQMQ